MSKRFQHEMEILALSERINISAHKMVEDLEIRHTRYYGKSRINPRSEQYKNILLAMLQPANASTHYKSPTYTSVGYKFGVPSYRVSQIVKELHRLLHNKYGVK